MTPLLAICAIVISLGAGVLTGLALSRPKAEGRVSDIAFAYWIGLASSAHDAFAAGHQLKALGLLEKLHVSLKESRAVAWPKRIDRAVRS